MCRKEKFSEGWQPVCLWQDAWTSHQVSQCPYECQSDSCKPGFDFFLLLFRCGWKLACINTSFAWLTSCADWWNIWQKTFNLWYLHCLLTATSIFSPHIETFSFLFFLVFSFHVVLFYFPKTIISVDVFPDVVYLRKAVVLEIGYLLLHQSTCRYLFLFS